MTKLFIYQPVKIRAVTVRNKTFLYFVQKSAFKKYPKTTFTLKKKIVDLCYQCGNNAMENFHEMICLKRVIK